MPKEISRKDVQRLMKAGTEVLDVLELSEYRESHLPGAVHIHLRRLADEARVMLDPDRPVVEAAREVHIGHLARGNAPSCTIEDRLGEVRTRVESAGWDQAVVLDQRRLEGPRTFRPNVSPDGTASWMDDRSDDSVLVTSSDGTFVGVLRREDLGVPRSAEGGADA